MKPVEMNVPMILAHANPQTKTGIIETDLSPLQTAYLSYPNLENHLLIPTIITLLNMPHHFRNLHQNEGAFS